jgi:hypothetical protein
MSLLNTELTLNNPTFKVSIQNPTEELIDQLENSPLQLASIGETVAQHTVDPFEDWDTLPSWEIPLTFISGTASHTESLEISAPLEVAIIESITPDSTIICKAEKTPGLYGKTWVDITIQIVGAVPLTAIGDTFTLANGEDVGNGKSVSIS